MTMSLSVKARPESLTVVNSYLHDSLASGISLKGARKIFVRDNVIERAGGLPTSHFCMAKHGMEIRIITP